MALLTKLEAVNNALKAIGQPPLTTLSSPTRETSQAIRALDNQNRNRQTNPYTFNTGYRVAYVPDGGGFIAIAAAVLSFSPTYQHEKVGYRNAKLWDPIRNTDVFTRTVYLNTISEIDFEQLPQHARMYISAAATREFAEDTLGDIRQDLREIESVARAEFTATECRMGGASLLDSYNVWQIAGAPNALSGGSSL